MAEQADDSRCIVWWKTAPRPSAFWPRRLLATRQSDDQSGGDRHQRQDNHFLSGPTVIETAGASLCAGRHDCLIAARLYHGGCPLTTPDALTLAKTAREALDSGTRYMMIEASSHALSQHRLAGIAFTAAAFTNLTGDHLDYHKTPENYLAAKAMLFEALPPHGMAVLNAQSDASKAIAAGIKRRILWYAIDEPADVSAHIHRMDDSGSEFSLEFGGIMEKVVTPLCGRHNISNHLAAAGLCLAAGFIISAIAQGLSALSCVPGRLEPVLSPIAERRASRCSSIMPTPTMPWPMS